MRPPATRKTLEFMTQAETDALVAESTAAQALRALDYSLAKLEKSKLRHALAVERHERARQVKEKEKNNLEYLKLALNTALVNYKEKEAAESMSLSLVRKKSSARELKIARVAAALATWEKAAANVAAPRSSGS